MTTACPSQTSYNRGCRCDGCRAAHATYRRNQRAGTLRNRDATPYRQLVRRLSDEGWRQADIADAVGVSRRTVQDISRGAVKTVQATTAELFDRFQPPPPLHKVAVTALPLLDAVDARGGPSTLPESQRRTYYRLAHAGRLSAAKADRLSIAWVGEPFELVYGADFYDDEVAA